MKILSEDSGKGNRVDQAASEQRAGLLKEDDTHRKKTSLDVTACTMMRRKFG